MKIPTTLDRKKKEEVMKNHYTYIYLLLLIVALLFSSCHGANRMESDNQTNEITTESDNQTDEITTESDTISVDVGGSESVTYDQVVDETPGDPPRCIVFDSMEQISGFIQAAKGSEAEWQQYWEQRGYLMPDFAQFEVTQIADTMERHLYPFAKEEVKVDAFNASLTPQYSKLDITFLVNGFTTRFIYFYTETDLPTYDYQLLLENMPIADKTMNLYQGEDNMYRGEELGSVILDTVPINIYIYSKDYANTPMNHFDCFEFREIGS